jgi:O-antigen ligase
MRARNFFVAHTGYFAQETSVARKAGAIDMLIRSGLFIAVFLTLWFSFHPFPTLDQPLEITDSGDPANQIGYSTFLILLAAWNLTHQPQRLLLLIRPIMIATLLWFAVTVVFSWEPSLSMRRLAFALVTISVAAMVLLLPRNPRHFAGLMAAVAIIVTVVCYLGVMVAPMHAIHQASDMLEPELAGDWRGVFSHKNDASAAMVIFIFSGLFVARERSRCLGVIVIALAVPFLYLTHSKTALAAMPIAYVVSLIMAHTRRPATGVGIAIVILLFLNLISIGSVYFEPAHDLVDAIMSDPSFTGRADVWRLAEDAVAQSPIVGHGFSAFWGTEQVVYGMSGKGWANTASHAHNGYLDMALTVGLPGTVLTTLWLLILPLVDFYRTPADADSAPLKMLFLRICLFAAYQSCFETMFTEVGALWMVLFVAVFGLRFLAVTRVSCPAVRPASP